MSNSDEIQIGVYQYAIGEDPQRNSARVADGVSAVRDALIGLPEMFLGRWNRATGDPVASAAAQKAAAESLRDIAGSAGLTFFGSALEYDAGVLYNSVWNIGGHSAAPIYRKVHRFSPLGEHERYGAGDRAVVVDVHGARVGVAICYDLRFGDLFTAMRAMGAQIVVIPSRWPRARIAHWRALLIARAIEFQSFIVGVNCLGEDRFDSTVVEYPGHSLIVDPWGEILADLGETEGLMMRTIDLRRVVDVRKKMPVWEDRAMLKK